MISIIFSYMFAASFTFSYSVAEIAEGVDKPVGWVYTYRSYLLLNIPLWIFVLVKLVLNRAG